MKIKNDRDEEVIAIDRLNRFVATNGKGFLKLTLEDIQIVLNLLEKQQDDYISKDKIRGVKTNEKDIEKGFL